MKHRTLTFGTLLLGLAALLSACQAQAPALPADPVEALQLISEKQQDIKSQHIDLDLNLELAMEGAPASDPIAAAFSNFKIDAGASGDVDLTAQNMALKGTANLGPLQMLLGMGDDELRFELVKVGDTLYGRLGDQAWSETPIDQVGDISLMSGAMDFGDMVDSADQIVRLADESIDGVDTYHFQITWDAQSFLEQLQQSGADLSNLGVGQVSDFLQNATLTTDLWVGKSDLFIRRQQTAMQFDVTGLPNMPPETSITMGIELAIDASRINEPVTITAPQ